jgi:hypothetical protein
MAKRLQIFLSFLLPVPEVDDDREKRVCSALPHMYWKKEDEI